MKTYAVVIMALLIGGPGRVARGDSTTDCRIDAWGDLRCTTTSSEPSSGGGKGSTAGGVAAATIFAGLIGWGVASRSDNPDVAHNEEVGLGIVIGVETFLNPLVLHFDSAEPDPEVKREWQHRTAVVAEVWASAVRVDGGTAGAPGGRLGIGKGRVGLEVAGEAATDPGRYSLVSAHALLRPPARGRTVLALAIGASRRSFGEQVRTGLDVSVPHAYILSRDDETGAADVMLSSRPGFFYGDGGIDVHLDLGLVVPLAGHVAVEVGGGVFTFDKQACVKGSAGVLFAR